MSNTVVAAGQKAEIKQVLPLCADCRSSWTLAVLQLLVLAFRQKVKEKLKELGVDKQIQEMLTHKVQPSASPKSAKQEAITQLKVLNLLFMFVATH